MCGISGYYKSKALSEVHIEAMAASIHHRGPDNLGFFKDENVCFGHNRLSIIDLDERSNQPFYSEDGRYALLYNGEVYNHREIAKKMNYNARTTGDTEIVLQAYLQYGDEFVHEFNGMFAIAIYDIQAKKLKIWRDRFGIKPMYYYWDGKDFAFASELKALYTLPFQKEVNPDALNMYLKYEYVPQPLTILKNFHKLSNGHQLNYETGKLEIKKYYDIREKCHAPSSIKEETAMEIFSDLFRNSLKLRKISDVPLGAFLSGGIDSSSVCSGLMDIGNELSTFNIGFEEDLFDESAYAREVAELLKTDHHTYQLKSSILIESLHEILCAYDDVFSPSSIFPTYKVCELASKNITVAMSGDGGDELFMGYGYYNWYRRLKKLNSPIGRNIRHVGAGVLNMMPSRYARVGRLLKYQNLEKDWPHVWSQEQYMFNQDEVEHLTGHVLQHDLLMENWQQLSEISTDPMQRISLFDLNHYLADDLLYKVDIASMSHSLEVRLPFLDHNLVEFVLNLPTNFKIQPGNQKYLLKKYLEKYLPKRLIYRQKWGFGAPVQSWMKNELKSYVEESLHPSNVNREGIFNSDFTSELIKDFKGGKDYLGQRIWSIIAFTEWKKIHLD